MKQSHAAIIGAVAITAAGILQSYFQGDFQNDPPNIIIIATWLFLGSLVGVGVFKFQNRKK